MDGFFLVFAVALAVAIRFTRRDLFQISPQDFLVAFFALAIPNLPHEMFGEFPIGYLFLRAAILFYACEYLVSMAAHRYVGLRLATFAALMIMGLRHWF